MFICIFMIIYYLITIHCTYCMELPEKKRSSRLIKRSSKVSLSKSGRSSSLDRDFSNRRNSMSLSSRKLSFSDEPHKETDKEINIINEYNKIDENGNTLLTSAVLKNKNKSVKSILKQNININHNNKWGNTALHIAVIQKNPKIIKLLLNDNRLNACICNSEGKTALDYLDRAMPYYNSIKNNIYLNMLLHLPKYNNYNYFNLTNLNNDTINATDDDGTSVLIWSICTNQSKDFIQYLLQYDNLTINHQDKLLGSALHYAALFGKTSILHLLLLDHRTNGNITNHFNQTPHHCVIKNFSFKKKNIYSDVKDVMSKMKFKENSEESSSTEEKESEKNHIALFSRAKLNQTIDQEILNILLQNIQNNTIKSFLTDKKTLSDETMFDIINAIHKNIKYEEEHQASTLPEYADLPKYANDEFLKKMIQFNFIENIVLILKKELFQEKYQNKHLNNEHVDNTTINTLDNKKNSILMWSICTNQPEDSIQHLLQYDNLAINHQDKFLNTALHYAALLNKEEIKLFLLDHRTDASLKNVFGQQPHDCLPIGKLNQDKKKLEKIHKALALRAKLNQAIHEELLCILGITGKQKSTGEVLLNKETISNIINEIKGIEKKETITSPLYAMDTLEIEKKETLILPNYATDTFLENMIQFVFTEKHLRK